MKKFILLGFLSLFAFALHAKEMTVRVVDTFGDPIVGITGSITESNSSWNADYSRFTTDKNGEFIVERTNMNFMEMYFDDYYEWKLPSNYEVVWNGGDEPVVVKTEGFCRFVFKLSGIESSEYDKIAIEPTDREGQSLPIKWNDDGRDTAWVAVDTTAQVWNWSLGGRILFAPQNQVENISDPRNREIVIDTPFSNMQKLSVGIIGRAGTGISGGIRIEKLQTVGVYDNIDISYASPDGLYDCYIPQGEYMATLVSCPQNYIIPAGQKINVTEEPCEVVFDYTKSYQATITVYDMDGTTPMSDATIEMDGTSQRFRTDQQGCATLFALPGEYVYDVRVWDPDYMAYEELQLNIVDADIEKSIHFSDVYTTLYVDVKLRPDMQRDLLQVELNGSPMSYDDIANLYSIKSRKKNVQCTFYYPGTFEEWIDIDSVAETPEFFSYEEYRKISISPEDTSKYRLDNIRIKMEGLYNTINATRFIYLIDSNYVATVDVYDKMTQISYKNEEIEFTVDGEDKDILYTFDASRFQNVTFKLIAPDGSPMPGGSISVTPASGGNSISLNSTDEAGMTTVKLPQGRYSYYCYGGSSFPQKSGDIMVDGEDVEIELSYEGYKKVNANVSGDLLESLSSLSISINGPSSYSLSLAKWNNYADSCYLPVGEYTCSYNASAEGNGMLVLEDTDLSLNEDASIDIELSSDVYKKVIFDIVDENGFPLYDPDNYNRENLFKIEAENGYTRTFDYDLPEYFYLKEGRYKASVMKLYDADWQASSFTVEGNSRIKVVYQTPKEYTLTFKVITSLPGAEIDIFISHNGKYITDHTFSANEDGIAQGEIILQEGDNYQCEIFPSGYSEKFSIHNDRVITIDISNFREVFIYFKNEKGELIDLSDESAYCILYHNNKIFDSDDRSYYRGYLMAGETYQVCASCYGYNTSIKEIFIGDKENQTFDIILSESASKVYALLMYPDIDITTSAGTLILDGKLTALTDFDGYIMVGDVAPGEHRYTIELEGYEAISGTIQVSPETADGIWVEVEYPINLSSIDENSANKSKGFAAYFFPGDKSIHIKPEGDVSGEWNVRLVSTSGVTAHQSMIYPGVGEMSIPADHLSAGFYLLLLDNGQEKCIIKLIVE